MAFARPPRVFRSPAARRRFLAHAAILLGVVALASATVVDRFPFLLDVEDARAYVEGFGVWAPVAIIVLQALQVVAAPIPGQVLGVVAGYLFGPWLGTLYNVLGVTIGTTLTFWLSRRFGRDYVESIVAPELLATFDSVDERSVLGTLLLAFLVPGLPDDVLCFVGGVTKVRLWKLVAVAIVGRTPGFLVLNVFGDQLGRGQYGTATLIAVAALVATAIGYRYRGRVLVLLGDRESDPDGGGHEPLR